GPHKTMLIAAIGGISQSTIRVENRNPLYRILFNISALVVTVEAAGAVYALFGGTIAPLGWPQSATAIVVAVCSYFLVNSGAVALAVALSTFQPLRRVWQQNFLWGAPSYFMGAGVSALIAEAAARQLWGLLPVAAVPLYLTYKAYVIFAGRLEDEHRHREVIESLNEGMAVIHRDGTVALWNDALERIVGLRREQALGQRLIAAVPALTETVLPAVIERVLETGKTETLDQFTMTGSHGRRTLQVRVFPFMRGVSVFWHDITDRAEAEAALQQSEERYALAAAGSNDGLWDWDLRRGEIYFSARWKEMIGLAPHMPCSRPEQWFERVHPDDV